jgi:RNA polymerase subunit RPABC4/transcription elongation factor Spt4
VFHCFVLFFFSLFIFIPLKKKNALKYCTIVTFFFNRMKCQRLECSRELQPDVKFCPECGFEQKTRALPSCPCGTRLALGVKFCSGCGKPVDPSLFADLKACTGCEKLLQPEERFCSGCGTRAPVVQEQAVVVTPVTVDPQTKPDAAGDTSATSSVQDQDRASSTAQSSEGKLGDGGDGVNGSTPGDSGSVNSSAPEPPQRGESSYSTVKSVKQLLDRQLSLTDTNMESSNDDKTDDKTDPTHSNTDADKENSSRRNGGVPTTGGDVMPAKRAQTSSSNADTPTTDGRKENGGEADKSTAYDDKNNNNDGEPMSTPVQCSDDAQQKYRTEVTAMVSDGAAGGDVSTDLTSAGNQYSQTLH